MFLIDDVLLAPGKAAYLLFQQIARKAQEEWLNDDVIKQELQELYGMLEAGRISDREFEARECRLLERLEQIARIKFQDKWGPSEAPGDGPIVESSVAVSALEPPRLPPVQALPLPLAARVEPPMIEPLSFDLPPMPPPIVTAPPVILPPIAPAAAPPIAPPQVAWPPAPPIAPLAVTPYVATLPVVAPPVVAPPVVAPPVIAPPAAAAPNGALSIGQVMECAVRALAMLKMRVSTITSVVPDQANWKVSVELVERRGIPDTNDVLGLYELWLDGSGNVLRYERTLMRRRCDFAR